MGRNANRNRTTEEKPLKTLEKIYYNRFSKRKDPGWHQPSKSRTMRLAQGLLYGSWVRALYKLSTERILFIAVKFGTVQLKIKETQIRFRHRTKVNFRLFLQINQEELISDWQLSYVQVEHLAVILGINQYKI